MYLYFQNHDFFIADVVIYSRSLGQSVTRLRRQVCPKRIVTVIRSLPCGRPVRDRRTTVFGSVVSVKFAAIAAIAHQNPDAQGDVHGCNTGSS